MAAVLTDTVSLARQQEGGGELYHEGAQRGQREPARFEPEYHEGGTVNVLFEGAEACGHQPIPTVVIIFFCWRSQHARAPCGPYCRPLYHCEAAWAPAYSCRERASMLLVIRGASL
eukprot:377747-Prorocentrum_minimum.AAC.1